MEKRSLFSRIFGTDNSTTPPATATSFRLLDDNKAVFTNYKGDYKDEIDVRVCIDAIARNGAKMHPKHIRNYFSKEQGREILEDVKSNLYYLLAKQPNEMQNAYQFYYQIITDLKQSHNSIVYISRDENLKVKGFYPLWFDNCEFYEYQDNIWIKFKFSKNKTRFVPLSSCVHLKEGVSKDGLFGGNIEPLKKILSVKHILDEGLINAIKTTQSIKGIVQASTMLKPEDVKKMRDQFVKDFMSSDNKIGIGGLDSNTKFTPVKIEPTIASDSQVKEIDNKILKYFGISENIITSNYTENEWNAFYESVIEPIGLQMSLEFSNKIFTPTEKSFGNEILFESNRLQYASNNTKIELLRYASNIMTINEQREIFNLAPIENGDVFMIDQNHEINEDVSEDINNNEEVNEDEGN